MYVLVSDTDYCISVATPVPTNLPTTLRPTNAPTLSPRLKLVEKSTVRIGNSTYVMKIGFCEGICTTDEDCDGKLVCLEVPFVNSVAQGCVLDVESLGNVSSEYVVTRETNTTNATENDGGTDVGISITLPPDDATVEPAVVSGNITIPPMDESDISVSKRQGGASAMSSFIRFCANPPTNAPTLFPTTASPTTAKPTNTPTPQPTLGPTPWPTPAVPIPLRANLVGNPPPDILGRCEGDCDSDSVCFNFFIHRSISSDVCFDLFTTPTTHLTVI